MPRPLLALALALALAAPGCRYAVTVTTGPAGGGGPIRSTAVVWAWGLVGADVSAFCAHGAARVEVYRGLLGWVVGILTCGFVLPHEVEVWPAAAPPAPAPAWPPAGAPVHVHVEAHGGGR